MKIHRLALPILVMMVLFTSTVSAGCWLDWDFPFLHCESDETEPSAFGQVVDGDMASWGREDWGVIQCPHVSRGFETWVECDVTSFRADDFDVCFGFDEPIADADVYYWTEFMHQEKVARAGNVSHSYTCETDNFEYEQNPNYAWCYDQSGNGSVLWEGSFISGNIPTKTVTYNRWEWVGFDWVDTEAYEDWKTVPASYYQHYSFDAGALGDEWYCFNDVTFDMNETKSIKAKLSMAEPSFDKELKYSVIAKQSSQTWADAIAEEKYVALDPAWIAGSTARNYINLSHSLEFNANFTLNVTLNLSTFTTDNLYVSDVTGTTVYKWINLTKIVGMDGAKFWLDLPNLTIGETQIYFWEMDTAQTIYSLENFTSPIWKDTGAYADELNIQNNTWTKLSGDDCINNFTHNHWGKNTGASWCPDAGSAEDRYELTGHITNLQNTTVWFWWYWDSTDTAGEMWTAIEDAGAPYQQRGLNDAVSTTNLWSRLDANGASPTATFGATGWKLFQTFGGSNGQTVPSFWNGTYVDVAASYAANGQIWMNSNNHFNIWDDMIITRYYDAEMPTVVQGVPENNANNIPTQDTPVVNSTLGTNLTTEDIYVWNMSTADADGDTVKSLYHWARSPDPYEVLYVPMEGGSDASTTYNFGQIGGNGTVSGATFNATGGFDGWGAYDMASPGDYNNYISIANTGGYYFNDDFSVEAVAKCSPRDTGYSQIINKMDGAGTGAVNFYLMWATTEQLQFRIGNESGTIAEGVTVGKTGLCNDKWHHIIGVYNHRINISLYVDGLRVNTNPSDIRNLYNSPDDIVVGGKDGETYALNGSISYVRMYNASLSFAQITNLYNNNSHIIDSTMTDGSDTWTGTVIPTDDEDTGIVKSADIVIRSVNPYFTYAVINSTNVNNYTNGTVNVYFDTDDLDSASVSSTVNWYKDSVLQASLVNFTSIAPGNTSKNQNWTALIDITDGTYTNFTSLYINIENAPPEKATMTPSTTTELFASTLNFTCTATDVDSDTLNYEFYVNYSDSLVLRQNTTLGTYKHTFNQGNGTYTSNCRANDDVAVGNWAGNVSIIYQSLALNTDCTGTVGKMFAIFNLSYANETDNAFMTTDLEATFWVWLEGDTIANNQTGSINLDDQNSTMVCVQAPTNSSLLRTTAQLRYSQSNYDVRDYYFIEHAVNNVTQNVTLYNIATSMANGISFTVQDQSEKALADRYIIVQRYDVTNNTYKTVSIMKTDDAGAAYGYFRKFDAQYLFKVQDGTEIEFLSNLRKITTNSLTFTIASSTYSNFLQDFDSVSTLLAYNNVTKIVTGTWSGGSAVDNVCLKVIKHTWTNDTELISDACSSDDVGSLSVDLSTKGNGTYVASLYAKENPQFLYDLLSFTEGVSHSLQQLDNDLGKEGLVIVFFMFVGVVTTALATGSAMYVILLGLVVLAVVGLLGFMSLPLAAFIAITIVGGVIIALIKRR